MCIVAIWLAWPPSVDLPIEVQVQPRFVSCSATLSIGHMSIVC